MNDTPAGAPRRRALLRTALLLLAALTPALGAAQQSPPATVGNRTTPRASAARPLSLDEAIRLAARESEALTIARAGIIRANGQQLQARSLSMPQLTGSLSYARALRSQFSALASSTPADTSTAPKPQSVCAPYIPPNATPAERDAALAQAQTCAAVQGIDFSKVGFGSKNTYTLGLAFSQSVYSGGRNAGQSAAANATRSTAEIELTSQRAQLALDVTQAYFDAVLADRLVEIADTTLAQTEELLRQTSVAKRVGNTSEFDLLRATVTRDNQRPVVIQRSGDRDVAYLRLKQLLNLPLDETVTLTTPIDEPAAITQVIAGNASGAPVTTVSVADSTALRRLPTADTTTALRAPVRESEEAVRAQEGLLKVARADRLPTLALTSNYQRLFLPSSLLPSLNQYAENWTVGGTIGVTLLSGGRVSGQIEVAQANLDEARARLKQSQELAALDTRVALNQLAAAEAAFSASRGTAEQARRAYSIDQLRYREGISTQTDLTQSRLLLEQSVANRAQSARDLAVARARVALIRDLPINTAAIGAAAQRNLQQQQQQQQTQPQQQQRAAQSSVAGGVGAPGGTTP
ncbi:MAG: outer rane efflux protein [Gemmatimonadetes bacterium]|nr:outer rane efflux protein [Gemmatimonadota bacterium]